MISRYLKISTLLIFCLIASQYESVAADIPSRIISLSPSATEDLYAIGAGKQVIAVDDNSNFPKGVPTSKLSSFNPNAEAITKYKPDLVILQSSASKSDVVVKQLKSLGISVYMEITPRDLSGAYQEIRKLGALTGHTENANSVIAKIEKTRKKALDIKHPKNINFYHEIDNTLYSATSATFIGKIYRDFGLINIADSAARADSGGYPKLQNEYVISANPKLIFLADAQYGETFAKLKLRPAWSSISAVKNGKVFLLPADISSRWGPRIANFYELVSHAIS